MDVKIWALLISILAFSLSLITFIRTNVWFSMVFNARMLSFKWSEKDNRDQCECKFILSCSGNQNIYIDKVYLNKGDTDIVSSDSLPSDVKVLLTPGEIKEFMFTADTSAFSHGENHTFVFTLISPNADQFHSALSMKTKEQYRRSIIVEAESFGSSRFALSSFNLIDILNLKQARARRNGN
ncbi:MULTISPECIES: hypothetical protein [unclassified Shewanella]|uniref:hypothetical protein n=1 Tax=unclassified Shewanella TaxID=196818 RepID=UPI001BC394F9|nr:MULTISPECIES: hypothetical protein [unclassified Shewanella]GIU08643.1 hypothetical protein TUM4444_10050 [Shewanella sp. MBTL60-112-B1]GIU38316.1 hypothetical protein TUM4445_32180 [Shewanella sp. MBTL60-112-B2]